MAHPALAHVAAAALLVASGLAWLLVDGDLDGPSTLSELRGGTQPWDGDSDGDFLSDGWESNNGLKPRDADPDRDGLDDWTEVTRRTNPAAADSDGDGLPDAREPLQDCDGDARPAGADGDDDADGRLDSLEPQSQRCRADVDGDGLLDGAEGAAVCVTRRDCDGDGLADAMESPSGLSPLDADTFNVGLPDSVSWAFAQAGQPAGSDLDGDGIPDPWEGSDGAIAWGGLTPRANRRDLLIEYLRVEGPDSGRFDLDFSPAYRAVASTFEAQGGIHVTWTETILDLTAEEVPPLVPSISDPYYAALLNRAHHATNPFVTTVVLNPQHDQSEVAHSGIAPIRGMIAAVDYGQSVVFTFSNTNGSRLLLTPFIEELLQAFATNPETDSQSLLVNANYDRASVGPGTRLNIHSRGPAGGSGYWLSWIPAWFNSALTVDFDSTAPDQKLQIESVQVSQGGLAHTILHELGHTLGLCHSHEPDCISISAADRPNQAQSTMSYDSADGTLRFLGSEWTKVVEYLTCPPVEPVTLLAQDAGDEALLESKYSVAVADIESVDARSCRTFLQVPFEFESGSPPASTFDAPAAFATPEVGYSYVAWHVGAAVVAVALAVALDIVLWRRLRSREPPLPPQPPAPSSPQPLWPGEGLG